MIQTINILIHKSKRPLPIPDIIILFLSGQPEIIERHISQVER